MAEPRQQLCSWAGPPAPRPRQESQTWVNSGLPPVTALCLSDGEPGTSKKPQGTEMQGIQSMRWWPMLCRAHVCAPPTQLFTCWPSSEAITSGHPTALVAVITVARPGLPAGTRPNPACRKPAQHWRGLLLAGSDHMEEPEEEEAASKPGQVETSSALWPD